MTDPVYIELPRADVVSYLGTAWPPAAGARCLVVTGCTDGLVAVYPNPGQPGYSYWVVDSCVPPQYGVDLSALALLLGIDPAVWVVPVPAHDDPDGPPVEWPPPPAPLTAPASQ